jgi:hypothetical protein
MMPRAVRRNRYMTEEEVLAMRRLWALRDTVASVPQTHGALATAFRCCRTTVARHLAGKSRAVEGARPGVSKVVARATKARNQWMFREMKKVDEVLPSSVVMKYPTLSSLRAALVAHHKVVSGEWRAVSTRSMARVFNDAGWRHLARPAVQAYTEKHIAARKAFAEQEMPLIKERQKLPKDNQARHPYVFQDESLFQLHGNSDDDAMWVAPGQQPYNCVRTRTRGEDKVMAFLFMSWSGVKVFFHDKPAPKDRVKGQKYNVTAQTMIRDAMEPARGWLKKEKKVLYWDNASQHSSKAMRAWLAKHKLEAKRGPPLSPDANMCEDFFAPLKRNVAKRHPKDVAELKKYIKEEAAKLNPQKFVANFEARVTTMHKQKGVPGNRLPRRAP